MLEETNFMHRPFYVQVEIFLCDTEEWYEIKNYTDDDDPVFDDNFYDQWDKLEGIDLWQTFDTPTPYINDKIYATGNEGNYVLTLTNEGDLVLFRKTTADRVLQEYEENPQQECLSDDVKRLIQERKELQYY